MFDPLSSSPEALLGGFVRLSIYPRQRRAWFWAAVVRTGHRYVLCRDVDLDPPVNPDVKEIRGGALWMHMICETPLDHWTVAMEAYAVALDNPTDAWNDERGERVGLAFDLEWEDRPGDHDHLYTYDAVDRYDRRCRVDGLLQLGSESLNLADVVGWRHHEWGVLDGIGPLSGAGLHKQWSDDNGGGGGAKWWSASEARDHRGSDGLVAPLYLDTSQGPSRLLRRLVHDQRLGFVWTAERYGTSP